MDNSIPVSFSFASSVVRDVPPKLGGQPDTLDLLGMSSEPQIELHRWWWIVSLSVRHCLCRILFRGVPLRQHIDSRSGLESERL